MFRSPKPTVSFYFSHLNKRINSLSRLSNRITNSSEEMEKVKDWNYKVIKKIEAGDYGKVYKCLSLETSKNVAIKMITIQNKHEGVPSFIISKVSLLKEVVHENIVRLLDVKSSGRRVYLIFEYLDLDLHSFIIKQKTTLDSGVIKAIMKQILAGLQCYHSLKVLHRDLKPSNLLIDLKGSKVKIANFGLAASYGVPHREYSYNEVEGPYKAPEMRICCSEYSTPIDLWAVGCLFAEMLTGKPLFPCEKKNHFSLIVSVLGKPTKETWPAVTYISELLDSYPQCESANLAEMFPGREPAGDDLLSNMICLDPEHRITANDAIQHKYIPYHNYVQDELKAPFTISSPSRRDLVSKFVKRDLKVLSKK